MHGYGGVERNRKEGFRWYLKAAQQGHKFAQYETGQCYMMGSGVEKNEAEGLKWLRKAAEQGNHKAMHDLGDYYFRHVTEPGKAAEAVKWNKMASEHPDDSEALTTLRLKREGMISY
ncbi:MAG: sel1 repeat family protein [Bacteroidaceae bacterium]|nr:sel1 repeat family protein [Bacteroidaceae bacterium]